MILLIESADTGESFQIDADGNIDKLKFELSLHQPIPPQDQILLCGPPFKVFDSIFNSSHDFDGKRIFLYDRKILGDDLLTPRIAKLRPLDVPPYEQTKDELPQLPPQISELYRYCQECLQRSKPYEYFIRESLNSFRKSIIQQSVQRDAINAAVLNMQDNYQNSLRPYIHLKSELMTQRKEFQDLLDGFDSNLENLSRTPIHPEISKVIPFPEAVSISTAENRSLLDCISVDRERLLYSQCLENHSKVGESLHRVDSFFEHLVQLVGGVSESQVDFARLEWLIKEIEDEELKQVDSMSKLRENYQVIYQLVSKLKIECSGEALGTEDRKIVNYLESKRREITELQLFEQMEMRAEKVKAVKLKMEQSQEHLGKQLFQTLRKIALVQSDIQYKVKKEIDWMKKLLLGSREGFYKHLSQLYHLPKHYLQLERELARRNAYNQFVSTELLNTFSRLESARDEEILRREEFMKLHGSNLPPIFFKSFPSLKEKPPLMQQNFQSMVEAVPDIPMKDSSIQSPFAKYRSDSGQVVNYANSSVQAEAEVEDLTPKYQELLESYDKLKKETQRLDDLVKQMEEQVADSPVHSKEDAVPSSHAKDEDALFQDVAEILQFIATTISEDASFANYFNDPLHKSNPQDDFQLRIFQSNRTVKSGDSHISLGKLSKDMISSFKLLTHNFSRKIRYPVISFMDFQAGDIALFMPAYVNNRKIWMAFNSGYPYRFLAEESLEIFLSKNKNKEQRASIIGRIYLIETKVADLDGSASDYNIPVGTEYHVCFAEPLYKHLVFGGPKKGTTSEVAAIKGKS